MNNIEYATYPIEGLEVRRGGRGGGGRSIGGRFGMSGGRARRKATVRNKGKRRKEMIMKKAFSWSLREVKRLKDDLDKLLKSGGSRQAVEEATEQLARRDVHALVGHSFDKPLGSIVGGALIIEEILDDEEDPRLEFEVELPENEDKWPSHVVDTVRNIEAGYIGGISPGFMIPPKEAVPNAETFEPEEDNPEVLIRVIHEAILVELSLVTRPSYSESSVDVRAEDLWNVPQKEIRLWL